MSDELFLLKNEKRRRKWKKYYRCSKIDFMFLFIRRGQTKSSLITHHHSIIETLTLPKEYSRKVFALVSRHHIFVDFFYKVHEISRDCWCSISECAFCFGDK